MICCHLFRRTTVGVATLMLLLCQGVAMADACKAIAPRADATEVQAPCHEPTAAGDTIDDSVCQSRCTAQFTTIEPLKLNIAIADLPIIIAGIAPPPTVELCPVARDLPLDPAHPPPLIRLYCRMLN